MFKIFKQILKNLFTAKHTVRVIYKSGATVDFRCYEFTVRARGPEIVEASWKHAGSKKPIHLNIGEVAAVWQLD